jgi:hypothetical protein
MSGEGPPAAVVEHAESIKAAQKLTVAQVGQLMQTRSCTKSHTQAAPSATQAQAKLTAAAAAAVATATAAAGTAPAIVAGVGGSRRGEGGGCGEIIGKD